MPQKKLAFIKIDEQAWCCHFYTQYKGWYYKPTNWILKLLKKSQYIEVINTFGIESEKVTKLENFKLKQNYK